MPARDELREKIADIYCEEAMGVRIGELNEYASDWIEKARRVADRILALLPPQPLFRTGDFVSSSGETLGWKIECDALSDADWDTLAAIYAEHNPPFGEVVGVDRGGIPFARALRSFSTAGDALVADDVLTTGASITEVMAQTGATRGVAAFDRSRRSLPPGVTALFRLMPPQPKLEWDDMDCLRVGKVVVGYVGLCRTEDKEKKRAAVEQAVKEALGWTR